MSAPLTLSASPIADAPAAPSPLYPRLRDVSAPLTSMHFAITMPEATPRCLFERSSVSTGSVPLSCLIGSSKPSRFSDVSAPLTLSASAIAAASSDDQRSLGVRVFYVFLEPS